MTPVIEARRNKILLLQPVILCVLLFSSLVLVQMVKTAKRTDDVLVVDLYFLPLFIILLGFFALLIHLAACQKKPIIACGKCKKTIPHNPTWDCGKCSMRSTETSILEPCQYCGVTQTGVFCSSCCELIPLRSGATKEQAAMTSQYIDKILAEGEAKKQAEARAEKERIREEARKNQKPPPTEAELYQRKVESMARKLLSNNDVIIRAEAWQKVEEEIGSNPNLDEERKKLILDAARKRMQDEMGM